MSVLIDATSRKCAICGGSDTRRLHQARFSEIVQGGCINGYAVVTCLNCGFCFADGIPCQTAFDTYYENLSKYEHAESNGQDSDDDRARFQHVFSIIRPYLPDCQSRILEIGCANGGLLALLKENGFVNLLGIDPSPVSSTLARDLHGLRVLTANLSNMPFEGQHFDFIILAGVLEHVRDLDHVLIRLSNILDVRGQLYISIPDASRYADGEDAPFQEFSTEHINFFGPKSLENLFLKQSFTMRHCQQKLLRVGQRTITPVIHAFFQKASADNGPVPRWVPDDETTQGLTTYIEESKRIDSLIQSTLDALASKHRPILVWGTGAHTLRLLATSRLSEVNISFFVDSNTCYQKKSLNGTRIIAPGDLLGRTEPILISSRRYQEEIASYIRDTLKLDNEVIRLYEL